MNQSKVKTIVFVCVRVSGRQIWHNEGLGVAFDSNGDDTMQSKFLRFVLDVLTFERECAGFIAFDNCGCEILQSEVLL